jgi:hypothetical protein
MLNKLFNKSIFYMFKDLKNYNIFYYYMSINLKISNESNYSNKSSKQITFEDLLEDGFADDPDLKKNMDNLDIESEKTNYDKYSGLSYNSANFIPWWGYVDNDYEYTEHIGNNLDDTAWDFNRDMFLYGMKYIGNISSDVVSSASDKIIKLASDINVNYIRELSDPIKYKEDLMKLVEEMAVSRMLMREQKNSQIGESSFDCKNHIIDIKDDFVEVLSLENKK